MLAEAIVISVGKAPAPSLSRVTLSFNSFDPCISALAFISASTIVPLTMLVLDTVMSVGKEPEPNFVRSTDSLATVSYTHLTLPTR